jgi:hypothetical protein
MGHPLKLTSLTKLARLGHFPPASQAGRHASPVFYTISLLWCRPQALSTSAEHVPKARESSFNEPLHCRIYISWFRKLTK